MDPRERKGDPDESLLSSIEGYLNEVWTAMPGIIESYNAAAQTAQVQVSIQPKVRDEQGNLHDTTITVLVDVPVFFPQGGGYTITFPVNEGDECLVVFADRCIDAWWAQGGVQPMAEIRAHDLSDGFAFVGFRSQPRVIENPSTTALQIRSEEYSGVSGTGELFEMSPGKINIVADELILHGRNKTTFDAGGTGFVYQPAQIDTYTDGVTANHHAPTPPEVPT